MDTKTQPEADRVYEDFEPYNEWDKYDGRFTVMLPGYRRDQMKVQVTSKPALRLIGERPTFQNRWRRFKLEFPIPSDYDTDSVTATFEGGKLTVKFAKLTNPKETTTNPPEEAPRPKEPSQKVNEQKGTPKAKEEKVETKETTTNPPEEAPRPKEPSQKADEQKGAQEGTPKAIEEKAETKTNDVSDQTTPPKENDTITEKRTEASIDKVAEKVRTNGSAETIEAATSNSPKTKDAKFIARCKTRLVDFTLSKALCNQDENEALGNSTTGLKKWKRLVACVMLILLIVGLGLYCRNTFGSSQGELDLEELLLFPY
ncbi:inactive protein RESTRICTED TEV MOVEMENT 2 isoform X2 [Medicago truncatula]|uniref:inactive protein RESTRICTED TEV MOVEMENT 2 isoform X2 n=1 Tax=Medicago truncatula TaxID=3880 RepID=UPI001967954A|nr:inactive protein RESTRICTED TEV MOVEMENT 2 isoform X2 [Medicago truncatula]